MRCLALFTSGLDSLLSARLMQEQGVEVVGLHIATPLCATGRQSAVQAAARLGIELTCVELSEEFCRLLRAPRFGRIELVAPCLDCRIAMFSRARDLLAKVEADFVISGEVVGQRPRTAVRDLEVVAHHAGLTDKLLRPLSAQLLPPTEPEIRGWVERSRLLAIQGKGRKVQFELAHSLGIQQIPPPRPDCPLLGEPLASRVREILADGSALDASQLPLLAIGRHVRVDRETRIVVGRNREENDALELFATQAGPGACWLAVPHGFVGPTALIIGPASPMACQQAAELVVRHGRSTGSSAERVVVQDRHVVSAVGD